MTQWSAQVCRQSSIRYNTSQFPGPSDLGHRRQDAGRIPSRSIQGRNVGSGSAFTSSGPGPGRGEMGISGIYAGVYKNARPSNIP
jgi:hypothetical protein